MPYRQIFISTQEKAENLLYAIGSKGNNLYFIDGYDDFTGISQEHIANIIDSFYFHNTKDETIIVHVTEKSVFDYLLEYSFTG